MTDITEISQWEATVPQVDITDPVLGGTTGESNQAVEKLANRTRFLYDMAQGFAAVVDVTTSGTIDNTFKRKLAYVDISTNIALAIAGLSNFNIGDRLYFKCKTAGIKCATITFAGSEKVYIRGQEKTKTWLYNGEEFQLMKLNSTHWEMISEHGNFGNVANDGMVRIQPPNTIIANGCRPEAGDPLLSRLDYARLFEEATAATLITTDFAWLSSNNYKCLFGSGNGTTTFRPPDMRAMFWRGLDLGRGTDLTRITGSPGGYEPDGLKTTSVPFSIPSKLHTASGSAVGVTDGPPGSFTYNGSGSFGTQSETTVKNAGLIPVIYY